MKPAEMLRQMCHKVLNQADIKAICKARGLPAQAASSPGVLESLLLTDCGLDVALGSLEPLEVALLHRLRAVDKPVDVSFFARFDPKSMDRRFYGTFTQRHQKVLKKIREQLVRKGVVLMAESSRAWTNKTQMESWLFWLPLEFHTHLPPLIASAKRLSGSGQWRDDVPRAKLRTAVGHASPELGKDDPLEITNGQLHWAGKPFRSLDLLDWQRRRWREESGAKQDAKGPTRSAYVLEPTGALFQILDTLNPDDWVDAAGLKLPLEVFCDAQVDSQQLCESGYRWGCLARQQADGVAWYRLAPSSSATNIAPHQYLDVASDGTVSVDLDAVPLESLEQLVAISDQRRAPSGRAALLLSPNMIRLGRMMGDVESLPVADWLQKNSTEFGEAFETCRQRYGKTILHENLAVARVSDLTLKVAIQKALGARAVPLGDEYLAFACDSFDEVKRVVAKSGHVVKEVTSREA